ncbi:dimethylmenaquinone methyltransferase [Hyphomicrobiales bacterium BP6-180914]|uniref:Dimethylmenaquinone methyltransferase n=2 Tax=Lichenifustis flavocetrariae TaxID=2949735 RepID=A0AA41YWW9_9HYPH|nr:dimethylmenaquinone methyltransferase [Lichenifustis flavocetrariae]MCW6508662.1 dimethylmenaquinone methyltransferase [Lichenifustis flavocetrariae]
MKITQLTHHDLDGYGASTVVGTYADVHRVVHVARYADVGPVVERELGRLRRAEQPEMLVMTDLGLEPVAVTFLKSFAAMNAKRGGELGHRLLVLDHHISSVDQLVAQGVRPASASGDDRPGLNRFSFDDPAIVVMVDETRCATRLAYDHRELYATHAPDAEMEAGIAALVAAVDAVDLWRKEHPIFRQALVLDEVFWDNVSGFIPAAHPQHDAFISRLLLGMAVRLGKGDVPATIEREVGAIRAHIIDTMLAGERDDDRDMTTRMRLAPLLARSPDLFQRIDGGAKVSFGLDAGTFQRVSDVIMASGDAALVINVQRSGSMAFRSNNETALATARKFSGGGHKDASGGRLPSGGATSLADAVAQIASVLNPPKPDLSKSPFAALQGFKA